MRVILRSSETGLFYAGPAAWTSNQAEAIDFGNTTRALDEAAAAGLENIELVMSFQEPQFEIPLTVFSLGS